MAALVLYQPPLDALLELSEYGGIVRMTPEYQQQDAAKSGYDPLLVPPLLAWMQHPYAVEWAWQRYHEALLEKIDKRYLQPRGLDTQEMRREVLQDGLLDKALKKRLQNSRDLYIEVPPSVTVEEVREAAAVAVATRKESHTEQPIAAQRIELVGLSWRIVVSFSARPFKMLIAILASRLGGPSTGTQGKVTSDSVEYWTPPNRFLQIFMNEPTYVLSLGCCAHDQGAHNHVLNHACS